MTQDVRDLIAEAREAMTERDDTGWFWVGRLVDALEAATRQPSEGEYILKLIESVKGSRSSVEIDGVKIMPCDEYGRTGVERDAAVAAIERVRGVLSKWESRQERNREILGSGALGHFQAIDCTGDLRAALDGAPEPEVKP